MLAEIILSAFIGWVLILSVVVIVTAVGRSTGLDSTEIVFGVLGLVLTTVVATLLGRLVMYLIRGW